MACKKKRPHWSELEPELLELILKKLLFPDIVRFRFVCSLWKTAVESYMASPFYAPILLQTPWLMVHNSQQQQQQQQQQPDQANINNSSLFFSLAENKVYKLNNVFGEFREKSWCVGSTRGWLVILDSTLNLHLLNPISRARIQLAMTPQYCSHPLCISSYKTSKFPRLYIHKAVLLSDPSPGKNKNFIVVVMFNMANNLAFYNYGDNKWEHFGDKNDYHDILGHTSGQLYALSTKEALEIWDFQGNSFPKMVKNVKCSTPLTTLKKSYRNYVTPCTDRMHIVIPYLVESSLGEVLLVLRAIELGKVLVLKYSSVQFIVFKMDFNAGEWVNVKGLLDRAIFLNRNESISVSTRDFPECQENSIYFTDDCIDANEGRDKGLYHGRDIGVYNFKQDKFTSRGELYSMKSDLQPPNPRCFWFLPTS